MQPILLARATLAFPSRFGVEDEYRGVRIRDGVWKRHWRIGQQEKERWDKSAKMQLSDGKC